MLGGHSQHGDLDAVALNELGHGPYGQHFKRAYALADDLRADIKEMRDAKTAILEAAIMGDGAAQVARARRPPPATPD